MILISFSGQANVCNLREGSFDSAVRINGLPGYFFKVHPDGKYIAFIENGNDLLDLETGKQYDLPGGVDPVWSPDGKFLTHPGDNDGMSFHHSEKAISSALLGKPNDSQPFNDDRLKGVYQSIGKQGDTYSVITDYQGASIARYKIEDEKFTTVGDVAPLCKNIPGIYSDLPMLSKDGKYLSSYDSTSRSTKIYSLNGNDCTLAVDLGFPTGKVSFNNDSSQITFHLDQFGEFDDGWFSGISKDKVKNVVSLKLEKKDEKLIPGEWSLVSKVTSAGDGGYYPDYDQAGNIYFLEDRDNYFQFIKVRQDQLEWFPFDAKIFRTSGDCQNCLAEPPKSSLEILSAMWARVCDQAEMNLNNSPLHATAIDPVECRKMVEDLWTPSLEVTKEALLSSCPKRNTEVGKITGVWDTNRMATAEGLINQRCIMCHTQPMEFEKEITIMVSTVPDKYESGEKVKVNSKLPRINLLESDPKTIQRMQHAVDSGTMPKGSSFTSDQQKMVREFLDRKLLDFSGDALEDDFQWSPRVNRYSPEHLAKKMEEELSPYQTQPEPMKDSIRRMVNCIYGNISCDNYVVEFESQIQGTPEEKEQQVMQMKCQVLAGVTPQECNDWYERTTLTEEKK